MDCQLSIANCRLGSDAVARRTVVLNWQSAIGNWQYTRLAVHASIMLAFGAIFVGCTAPHRTYQPPLDPSALDDTAFLHYLATVPTVTVAEGVRAVGLLLDPTPTPASYDDQRRRLEAVGALKPGWALDPNETLDKGTLAHMLTLICKTPRSLNETAAAVTKLGDRRYALKTCIDEGLLPYGLPHDPVTGGELLSALSKADRYTVVAKINKP